MDWRLLQTIMLLVCISACGSAATRNGSAPDPTLGQDSLDRTLSMLKPDTFARIVAGGDTVEGQVVSYQDGALTLRIADVERLTTPDAPSLALVRKDNLEALWERRVSKRRARIAGTVVGGILGAALGYWLVDTYENPFEGSYDPSDADYATGMAIGAAAGVVLCGLATEVISNGRPVWKQLYPSQ